MKLSRRRSLTNATKQIRYFQRIKQLFGSSLIGYWPLWETSGTIAVDISGNRRNASYNGVTLANATGPDRKSYPLFDTDDVNLYSASLRAAFTPTEFTLFLWSKPNAAFDDATSRYVGQLRADSTNLVYIAHTAIANRLDFRYLAGGTGPVLSVTDHNPLNWVVYAISVSVSGGWARSYINGVQQKTDVTSFGTWAGSLATTNTVAGASGSTAGAPWTGWLGNVGILNRAATDVELKTMFRYAGLGYTTVTVFGDSISIMASGWQVLLSQQYKSGKITLSSRAVSTTSIMADFATYVPYAAQDNANIIIIAYGTNDDNAGDMVALQAKVEEQIAILKISNLQANLYYLNVLPRWTNIGGGTVVDKSNIRTAIAAACVSQGVTCWDTFTTPWITAAQTLDGCHPTADGHAAIIAQVLTRLP